MSRDEPGPVDELLTYLDGLGWDHLYVSRQAVERARGASPSPPRPGSASSPRPEPRPAPPSAPEPSAPAATAVSAAAAADEAAAPLAVAGPLPGLFGAAGADEAAALSPAERTERLEAVCETAQSCIACRLAQGRTRVVFGSGDPNADLMFIGEAPGADEDRQGLPFVGAAGQLLTKIIGAIDRTRDEVYICNMVKCRPPNNRDPAADELAACRGYLERQIDLVRPRVIVALGRVAAQALLDTTTSLGRLRGRWHLVRGVETRVTYHPAALLRFASYKRPTWEDMKIVRDRLASLPPRDA